MSAPVEPQQRHEDRLESWKEIAAHLNKGVRTVIRWEKTEGLPVHRHLHQRKASVFAFRSEIDQWWRSRRPELDAEAIPAEANPAVVPDDRNAVVRARPPWPVWIVAILIFLTAGSLIRWSGKSSLVVVGELTTEPVTSYPGEQYSPAFSPAGEHIAFVWNGPQMDNFDLYRQAIGSANPQRLTADPGVDFSPSWSPGGEWIAFLRRTPELATSVWVMPATGGSERKLAELGLPLYMDGTELSWSADSQWLAVPHHENGKSGIFLLSTGTGARRRLTTSSQYRGDTNPAFSPDGKHLAFRCNNTEEYSQICLLTLSPEYRPVGEPTELTPGGQRAANPAWTPDGQSLVYTAGNSESQGGLYQLTVFPVEAGSRRPVRLFDGRDHEHAAAISRKGDLVFARKSANTDIWMLRKERGGWSQPERFLAVSSSYQDHWPDLSPDGRKVALSSDRSGSTEIWSISLDGKVAKRLTSFGGEPAQAPRWSPDGKQIAFSTGRGDESGLFVMDEAGKAQRKLTNAGCCPSWSTDGKWLYFYSDTGTNRTLMKIPSAGGPAVAIGTTEASNSYFGEPGPQESPDGRFVYYRRTNGMWRYPLHGGPEERVLQLEGCQSWLVAQGGLITMRILGPHLANATTPILFHDLMTSAVREIARTPFRLDRGLTMSADERVILFSQDDHTQSNVLRLKGFRRD